MRRPTAFAAALALAAALTVSLFATAPATILLKSGNRVSGELLEFDRAGIHIIVEGRTVTFSPAEVAVIDLRGDARNLPQNEVNRAQEGRGVYVLSGGRIFDGQLVDIGGTSPINLTFSTPSGQRELTSSEVERIYLGPVPGGSAGSQPEIQPGVPGGVIVPASRQWTSTGISVRRGDRISFSASGEVQLSGDSNDRARPAGSLTGRYANGAPLPSALAGALIGRVGNSQAFGIGDQTVPLVMPADGQLFLGINDDATGDNSGQFNVTISGARNRTRNR